MRWKQDSLYTSFSSDKFRTDYKIIDRKIENYITTIEAIIKDKNDPIKKIETIVKESINLLSLYSKLIKFASLEFSVDVKNTEASKFIHRLKMKYISISVANVKYQKWLKNLSKNTKFQTGKFN